MSNLIGKPWPLPGAYGINTQNDVAITSATQFGLQISNGVIDQSGKLTSRKDFVLQTSGGFSAVVEQIYCHRNNGGTETVFSAAGGKIYSGIAILTERKDNSGTSAVLNSPQFASLSGRVFAFQAGIAPMCLNETTFASEAFTGAVWTATPNVVVAGGGRLWVADDAAGSNRYTVWWSNLLDGKTWNAGDAGSLNLQYAFPKGQDSITALAFLSNRLVIFGRSSILMYTLPSDQDPANMELTDSIENLGCTARDSVIVAQGDVYFLSDDGFYKLPKLEDLGKLPKPVKVSKLVADDFNTTYASETLTKVRAGYNPTEKFLVLNAPTANLCYVFHTDRIIPEIETPPVTTWTNVAVPFLGFCYDKSGNWYCGMRNGVGKYTGYTPDGASNAYTFDFFTQWDPLGNEEARVKHLKSYSMTLEAASGQTGTFRWKTDYLDGTSNGVSFTCSSAEFAENPGIGIVRGPIGKSCNAAKFGFSVTISTAKVMLHSLRVFLTPGAVKVR